MRKIILKGGYGEHGRNCFLAEYGTAGRMFMVDCGIMDTDPNPYPDVSAEELSRVDYLFLTHCHKDHSGAFMHLCGSAGTVSGTDAASDGASAADSGCRRTGFTGTLITSAMTYGLSGLDYEKRLLLPIDDRIGMVRLGELTVRYGRTGHCPGALWFHMVDRQGSLFFSGDYQSNSRLYACDAVTGFRADLAVADCAHNGTALRADALREELFQAVEAALSAGVDGSATPTGRRVIFPVPQYGRGLELFCLLKERFSDRKIRVDQEFLRCAERMMAEAVWYRPEAFDKLRGMPEPAPEDSDFDILLLADTHLTRPENQALVKREADRGTVVVVTGRVRSGGLPDRLLSKGHARRILFPHHQSRGDLEEMLSRNDFTVVLPFHNAEQAVFLAKI